MQPDTLIANLSQFTGTETWHRRRGTSILYTDGVRYLADNANAWWLVDAIASHQANPILRYETLQIWHLMKTGRSARLTCSHDFRGYPVDIYITQEIPNTDFPLKRFTLYLDEKVLMLPGER